jgi:2-oxoisovalerate dehydrogenase E1 component alpha subunit
MLGDMHSILAPDGNLKSGARIPSLRPDQLLNLYRLMCMNRGVDDQMFRLQRQGRLGFYVGAHGEEAAIIGSAFALERRDWIVPCYRELGAALVKGFPLVDLFNQFLGNSQDRIKGRQMPNHYASRDLRFTSISSPVGSQIPHAIGLGLGAQLAGCDDVTLVYFGDGASSQGDFHVSANFAGVFKTPTILFCRNNQWAISVPFESQTASRNIAVKADAYGIEGVLVDGNDILAVYDATSKAVAKARGGEGPTLIEAVTYRRGGHSTSDDPTSYRDAAEVEAWIERDPILRLRLFLTRQGHWDDEKEKELEAEIRRTIRSALEEAFRPGPPSLETVFDDVYDKMPWHLREQMESVCMPEEYQTVEQGS